MVKIFGKEYFIDIEKVSETCKFNDSSVDENGNKTYEINIFKYEIIKMCMERLLNEYEDVDEEMGQFSQKDTSISFRLAFNTLLKNNIIIEMETEIDELF